LNKVITVAALKRFGKTWNIQKIINSFLLILAQVEEKGAGYFLPISAQSTFG